MGKSNGEYEAFINSTQKCPNCGGKMIYTGGLLDWECQKCGTEGDTEFDDVNKEYYVSTYGLGSYENIYDDDSEIPHYCKICGGPFPDCIVGCDVFDN